MKNILSRFIITLITLVLCQMVCSANSIITVNGVEYSIYSAGDYRYYYDKDGQYRYTTVENSCAYVYSINWYKPETVIIQDTIIDVFSRKYPVEYFHIRALNDIYNVNIVNKIVFPSTLKEFDFSHCSVDSIIIPYSNTPLKIKQPATKPASDEQFTKYVELHRQVINTISGWPYKVYKYVNEIAIGSDVTEFNLEDLYYTANIVNILPGNDTIAITPGGYFDTLCIGRNIRVNRTGNAYKKTLKINNITYPTQIHDYYTQINSLILGKGVTGFDYRLLNKLDAKYIDSYEDIPECVFDRNMGLIYNQDKTKLLFSNKRPIDQPQYNTIILPETVKEICDNVFYNTAIETLTANQLDTIGVNAFYKSGIKSINEDALHETKIIGDNAFNSCSNLAINLNLPKIDSIGESAFCNSGIKSLTLAPSLIKSIEKNTFQNCYNLENIVLGESIHTIGDYAFANCHKIPQIHLGKSLITIGDYAFANCYKIPQIHLGDSLITIGDYAFSHLINLDEIHFGKNIQSIGDYAFESCIKLQDIEFNENLATIGNHAFEECRQLKNVHFPDNLKSIGTKAFYNNLKLKKATLSPALEMIGSGAFCNCLELEQSDLPESLKEIGDSTFYRCTKFTDLQLDNNITTIGQAAFARCDLANINIYSNVKSFGHEAFAFNPNLKSIYYDAINPVPAPDDLFSDYETATLYIPRGTFFNYWKVSPWNKFKYIQEDSSMSSIDAITTDDTDTPIQYFDLTGRQVENPNPGIYILKQGNITRKVIIH